MDNVGIINNTCKLANIPRVNPDNIPEDDVDVWNSIREDTSLIFQWNSNFGSQTMKKLFSDETIAKIRKVYPNITYIDLFSFGNALIRPCGKSQYDSAVNGEIKPTGVKDIDDLLSSELNRCLFQEDIMSFVMQFCGYNFIQADKLRKIIGKKLGTKEQIPVVKKAFEENAKVKYNLTDEKSEEIIEPVLQCILDATRYSFSKNHAYAYSWIGYMCGYLRYHYPIEYLASCLDIFADDDKKTNEAVAYANKLRVTIFPPKFGHANANYMPDKENHAIYKGMKSIKYMNSDVANKLYDVAKSRTFDSFTDVLYAIKDADIGIDSRQMKSLIQLDFFDCFGNAKELLRIYNMFNDFFKKGEAVSISKDKVDGNATIKAIIERHSVGVTKTGKPAKSYSQLDCQAVVKECEEYLLSLGIPDFSIKDKIAFHNEYFGYIGIITNKPEDRPRLIVTNVRPLEKDGSVWGYGVTAQSLGSGKKSDYTVYARGMTDEIKVNDVILVRKVEKNQRGYWIIKNYRVEVGV